MSFEERLIIGNEGQVYELPSLDPLNELARERAVHERFPRVYPREEEAVRGMVNAIKDVWRAGQKNKEYGGLLLRLANAWRKEGDQGVQEFIYGNLAVLISNITSGKIEDFDEYTECEHGDSALALLYKHAGSYELVEAAMPKLERKVFYPDGKDPGAAREEDHDRGVILFVCGYGASLESYGGIFEQFNVPVVAYQLPYDVIGDDPDSVGEAFNRVHKEMLADSLLDDVRYVAGNSIGTMLASRLAVDLCKRDPEKNIQLALVQTGASWPGALKKTHVKFGEQVNRKVKSRGLTFDDFSEATKEYNPIELAGDFSERIDSGQMKLTLCVGLADKTIYPASEEIEPLLKVLDASRAKGKYDAFTSEVAGHNSAMLFFLWLARQKATEWSRVCKFFDPETDTIETPEALEKYHRRRSKRRVQHLTGVR